MSSITLSSQSFRPALSPAVGTAARGLAVAHTQLAALLRSAIDTATQRVHAMRQNALASDLRERAQSHLAASPSYAADLLALAEAHQPVVEQA